MDARPCMQPILVAIPLKFGLHRFGHPPTMGKTELGEYGTGGIHAKVLDEILAQKPHRNRIEQQRSLSGEADYASFRIQFQQLFMIKISRSHRPTLSFVLKG